MSGRELYLAGARLVATECAKMDPAFERTMAEEGLSEDLAAWALNIKR